MTSWTGAIAYLTTTWISPILSKQHNISHAITSCLSINQTNSEYLVFGLKLGGWVSAITNVSNVFRIIISNYKSSLLLPDEVLSKGTFVVRESGRSLQLKHCHHLSGLDGLSLPVPHQKERWREQDQREMAKEHRNKISKNEVRSLFFQN